MERRQQQLPRPPVLITAQSHYRLRTNQRLEWPAQCTRGIKKLGIVVRQDHLQRLRMTEKDQSSATLAKSKCEAVSILAVASPQKEKRVQDPLQHLPHAGRLWTVGERHGYSLHQL